MHAGVAQRRLEFALIRQADKIRVALALFLLLAVWLAAPAVPVDPSLAYPALLIALLGSIWSRFFLRWDQLLLRRSLLLSVVLIILFDLGWLTLFLLGSGGAHGPFCGFLVLPVIFSATFFSGVSLALPLTAVLAGAVLALLGLTAGELSPAELWRLLGLELLILFVAWFAWVLAAAVERERSTHERLVRHLTEGVMLISAHGTILMANPRLALLVGLDPEEFVGRPLEEVRALPGGALLARITETAAQRPREPQVTELTLTGRTTADLRVITVPAGLPGQHAEGWVVLVQDITEVKTLARLKDRGLGVLSHELRSPLASLRVMAQLLGGMAGELTLGERERVAATIDREADRLSRLVGTMLDVARIEDPTFQLHCGPLSVHETVDQVLHLFDLRAEQVGITLRRELPPDLPPLHADPDRLTQILTNLLDNALKHTPAGGEIRLSAQQRDDCLELVVEDTGPGVPLEARELIFEKFGQVRTEGARPGTTGAGLGLYVARALARKHGGDLFLQSFPGPGSRFVLRLPLAGPPAEPHPAPPAPEQAT